MKLHSVVDCITNSSSTTFIVGFEKIPETAEQMYKLLFPNGETILSCYDNNMSAEEAAEIVFNDMTEHSDRIYSKLQFIQEYSSGWFAEYPDFNDGTKYPEIVKLKKEFWALDREYREKYGKDTTFKDHPAWEKKRSEILGKKLALQKAATDDAAEAGASEKWEKMKDLELFVFSYSDGDTVGSIMEHGDLFHHVKHISISHH